MGKMLTLEDLKKKAIEKDMPLGTLEVPFERLDYKPDENGYMAGAFVHFEGFRSVYLPFTNGEINYQLGYLVEQLGLDTYDPDEINKAAGTVVKVSRYEKETEKVLSKNEYREKMKEFKGGSVPTYIEFKQNKDGTVTQKNTFINTNFNLKTIKD